MVCRDCGNEFERKTVKRGYVNQCDDCSLGTEDVEQYIANPDGEETHIIRTNISAVKAYMNEERDTFNQVITPDSKVSDFTPDDEVLGELSSEETLSVSTEQELVEVTA